MPTPPPTDVIAPRGRLWSGVAHLRRPAARQRTVCGLVLRADDLWLPYEPHNGEIICPYCTEGRVPRPGEQIPGQETLWG